MKRQRGRGGRKSGHQPNRNFESTGPDIKIRGSASHVYEKYLQLARDAQSSGDRVLAESYMQHAEHYFRVLRAMQPQQPIHTQFEQRFDQSYDVEDGDEGDEGEDGDMDAAPGEGEQPEFAAPQQREGRREHRDNRPPREHRDPRPPREHREFREAREPREHREPREPREPREGGDPALAEGGEGRDEFRRGRRRRGRFRPEGERGPREGGDEGRASGPTEGFGDAAPAFLGGE